MMSNVARYCARLLASQALPLTERANLLNNPTYVNSEQFTEKLTHYTTLMQNKLNSRNLVLNENDEETRTVICELLQCSFAEITGQSYKFSEFISSIEQFPQLSNFVVIERPLWQTAYEHLMSVYYSMPFNEKVKFSQLKNHLRAGMAPEITKCIELLTYSYWSSNRYNVSKLAIDLELIASNTQYYCITRFSPLDSDNLLSFIRWKFKNNVLTAVGKKNEVQSLEDAREKGTAEKLEEQILEIDQLYNSCADMITLILQTSDFKPSSTLAESTDDTSVESMIYRADAITLVQLAAVNLINKYKLASGKFARSRIEILRQMLFHDNFENREIADNSDLSYNNIHHGKLKVLDDLKNEVILILDDYAEEFLDVYY